ncbi:MAG TPA: trypsin-like peptidase domain-containing protein, partial [Vicinamibacterales bacterium]
MFPRSRIVLAAAFLAVACRTSAPGLDDAAKLAYEVKPAVVRVSAYATATFRYRRTTILALERALHDGGYDFAAHDVPDADEGSVDTGAGGSGTGFVIHPNGYILTSGHVVAPTRDSAALQRDLRRNGAIAALLKHFSVDDLRRLHRDDALDRFVEPLAAAGAVDRIVTVNDVELSNGDKLPFRVERYSPALAQGGADIALLSVARKDLPVVRLGDSDSIRIGDSIWSIGYPAVASSSDDVIGGWLSRDSDLEATTNPGSITAIKRDVTNAPVFQSNVAIYRGNSGGPAVNRDGDVIAIST